MKKQEMIKIMIAEEKHYYQNTIPNLKFVYVS